MYIYIRIETPKGKQPWGYPRLQTQLCSWYIPHPSQSPRPHLQQRKESKSCHGYNRELGRKDFFKDHR